MFLNISKLRKIVTYFSALTILRKISKLDSLNSPTVAT